MEQETKAADEKISGGAGRGAGTGLEDELNSAVGAGRIGFVYGPSCGLQRTGC